MEDSRVSDTLVIQSHRGPYEVFFDEPPVFDPARFLEPESHFLVDANVARLWASSLREILAHPNTIIIEAREENKAVDRTIPVFERLVANRVRRDHVLIAIGGGIIQDICCFIASTLLRGLPWRFVPTTLLAQADSCIGSKSSINLGSTKNILGTFHPPMDVFVHAAFLDTLEPKEVRSGIGEILKVHAIDGASSFDALAADFDVLTEDRAVLARYVRSALRIKQRFIEADEFDKGIRNVFNYGHSFGHAIESATSYGIPHGVAVSIGMDLANHVATKQGLLPAGHFERMHPPLRANYEAFAGEAIPFGPMWAALKKDKKNTNTALGLILPVGPDARIEKVAMVPDDELREQCAAFLEEVRR
jgi:3-dehydroquinate synthase